MTSASWHPTTWARGKAAEGASLPSRVAASSCVLAPGASACAKRSAQGSGAGRSHPSAPPSADEARSCAEVEGPASPARLLAAPASLCHKLPAGCAQPAAAPPPKAHSLLCLPPPSPILAKPAKPARGSPAWPCWPARNTAQPCTESTLPLQCVPPSQGLTCVALMACQKHCPAVHRVHVTHAIRSTQPGPHLRGLDGLPETLSSRAQSPHYPCNAFHPARATPAWP
jgi:hypothetical protein